MAIDATRMAKRLVGAHIASGKQPTVVSPPMWTFGQVGGVVRALALTVAVASIAGCGGDTATSQKPVSAADEPGGTTAAASADESAPVNIASAYNDRAFQCPVSAQRISALLNSTVTRYQDEGPGDDCQFTGDDYSVTIIRSDRVAADERTHFESGGQATVSDRSDLGPGGFEIATDKSLNLHFTPPGTHSTWNVGIAANTAPDDRSSLDKAALALIGSR